MHTITVSVTNLFVAFVFQEVFWIDFVTIFVTILLP